MELRKEDIKTNRRLNAPKEERGDKYVYPSPKKGEEDVAMQGHCIWDNRE